MILVLSGTDDGREIAAALSEAGYAVVSSVSTVLEAAKYATGAVIAGEMTEERLREIAEKHNITGIIDARSNFCDKSNSIALAASECDIRYVKYAKRPHTEYDSGVVSIDKLDDFYDYLEVNLLNTLLVLDDATIKLVLDGLAETDFLFVACLKGARLDYANQLTELNIPLTNILEVDSLTSEEELYLTYQKYGIKNIIIKDGALTAPTIIAAAKRANAAVVAIDTDKFADSGFYTTPEQVLDVVENWG